MKVKFRCATFAILVLVFASELKAQQSGKVTYAANTDCENGAPLSEVSDPGMITIDLDKKYILMRWFGQTENSVWNIARIDDYEYNGEKYKLLVLNNVEWQVAFYYPKSKKIHFVPMKTNHSCLDLYFK